MALQTLNNGEIGSSFRGKLNSMFTELYAAIAGVSATLTVNTTPTSGAASGDILTSDGSKLQKVTPGTGVATALANSLNTTSGLASGAAALGLLGLHYVTDTRASGGTAGAITLALTDAGFKLYHPATDAISRVVNIDTNAHVAFTDTQAIPFFVEPGAGTLVFTPAVGVTLWMNGASVSTATAAAGYGGILWHETGDKWSISGENLA